MALSLGFFIVITRLLLKTVWAQVSPQNPLIWQTLVTPVGNEQYNRIPNATVKYYSQDFQTVYYNKDNFGHDERIVINAGDGCNMPTYDDMDYFNNNNGNIKSSFIKHQDLMGLVSRGGCSWSTKINNLQNFVQGNSMLRITGILIYDNTTWEVPIITSQPSNRSTPVWNSTLLVPVQRNISLMKDNDVKSLQPFIAVYFVPRLFALDMLSKMNNSQQSFVQLAPLFTNVDMPVSSNGDDDPNDSGNATFDSFWGGGMNRGYIAYIVAAGVAIIVAVILFWWCRKPRRVSRRNDGNDESPIIMSNQVSRQQQDVSIPIERLETLCPIQPADQVTTLMKNTVCAICLDDFKPTTLLRLLPCHHGFCVECIDGWLTKKSSQCPICKCDCCDGDLGTMALGNYTHPSTSNEDSTGVNPPSYSSIQSTTTA